MPDEIVKLQSCIEDLERLKKKWHGVRSVQQAGCLDFRMNTSSYLCQAIDSLHQPLIDHAINLAKNKLIKLATEQKVRAERLLNE